MKTTKSVSVGTGTLSFETGRLAKQADGATLVRLGDTGEDPTETYKKFPVRTRPSRLEP